MRGGGGKNCAPLGVGDILCGAVRWEELLMGFLRGRRVGFRHYLILWVRLHPLSTKKERCVSWGHGPTKNNVVNTTEQTEKE